MIEAVVNVSEGRDLGIVGQIGAAAGKLLLDTHSDPFHHRSVYTLAGEAEEIELATLALSRRAVELVDLSGHRGVHPRLGAVDVVPFVPYAEPYEVALAARDRFAAALSSEEVPCFLYGPERTLPEIRRRAWVSLSPDLGPKAPHPTAGATCVGVRGVLVAYNLVIESTIERARGIARALRGPSVRALGLPVGGEVQVSFNLIEPDRVGPAQVYDEVERLVPIRRSELVGLVPGPVLERIPRARWRQLDLAEERTVEARLAALR